MSETATSAPLGAWKVPSAPRWYLTSPEPCAVLRVDVALELVEDLRVGLADDVGEDVEPAAVRHADDDLVQLLWSAASASTASSSAMTVSAPSRLNRFWPTYLVCRNVSNASATLSRPRMCNCSSRVGWRVLDLDALPGSTGAARGR